MTSIEARGGCRNISVCLRTRGCEKGAKLVALKSMKVFTAMYTRLLRFCDIKNDIKIPILDFVGVKRSFSISGVRGLQRRGISLRNRV